MANNKLEQIVKEVLDKYAGLMEKLANREVFEKENATQKEMDIALWLLNNREGLLEEIRKSHNSQWRLLPEQIMHIYLDNYKNLILLTIKQQLQLNFEINPEEMMDLITIRFIAKILGTDFLEPPK